MKPKLTCAIIDDEHLAADLLASYVKKTPFLDLVGTFYSAVEAIKTLCEIPVDLLFLDVQMPELSGIEFAKVLPKSTKVVFTTAYKQYAIESYQVNTVDYLIKPISYDDFLKAANKVLKYAEPKESANEFTLRDGFIFVKSEYKLIKVNIDDILFVHGLKDYVKIYLADGTNIMSLMNLSKIQDNFPYPEFMRVHRSYIVHIKKADMIDRLRFVFGNQYIPVSETYKEEVQRYIEQHTI